MATWLHNSRQRRSTAGFTVVEMLIVVAIVILLLSILIVALSAAARSSQKASTSVRMEAMKRGLVQFKSDVGYYPPILNMQRGLNLTASLDPINPAYRNAVQDYYSVTTPAEYLMGYGPRAQDGFGAPIGNNTDSERPPFGIRPPGEDGVWGAVDNPFSGQPANGSLTSRNPKFTGDIFGPYLDLSDDRLLACIDGTFDPSGKLNVYFPGEAGYNDAGTKVIVDYWGRPIHYYRRPYPIGGIRSGFRQVDRNNDGLADPVPSLGDIWVLRPFEIPPGMDVTGIPDGAGDTATTNALNTADFALFSAGPDLAFQAKVRYDDPSIDASYKFNNRDNIVELGR